MTVRTRLLACFGLIVVALLVPSLFAASRLALLRDLAVEGRSGQAAAVASLGRIQATVADLDRLERSFVATADPHIGEAATRTADSLRSDYERLRSSPYGEPTIGLGRAIDEVGRWVRDVDHDMRAGRVEDATLLLGRMIDEFDDVDLLVASVADSIGAQSRRDFQRAEAVSAQARTKTLVGLGLAVALALLVTALVTNALTTPLLELSRAMARVSDGGLEAPADLPYGRADEIGELSRSFEAMALRLAELDRMKAEFLGMASHELKTPLNVIGAYAELIGEERGADDSDRYRSLVAGVAEQAQHMSRLVSRLMDISRLEAGGYELSMERVWLEDLITGIRRMFEHMAEQRAVELTVRVSHSAPRLAMMDVDVMRDEVLGNLISNALRYTPTGGRIELNVDGEDGRLVFTVSDSGPGIPEEHRDFVFEKHYTIDRSRKLGSGLGLAIAKEMVELHGGLISLEEPEAGSGARFRVALPLAPASVEAWVEAMGRVREA